MMSKWYEHEGKNADVVLFSRIRLARNLADYPFPSRMSDEIRKTVTKKLYATLKSSEYANEFDLINLSECGSKPRPCQEGRLVYAQQKRGHFGDVLRGGPY